MGTTIQPIIFKTQETPGFLNSLEASIKSKYPKDYDLLLNYPVVYIHTWQSYTDLLNGRFSIYIGETNDILQRTNNHWAEARVPKAHRGKGNWQYHMVEDKDANGNTVVPTLYIIGHQKMHKSLTLDIENRLIDYCLALQTANCKNGRTNIQGDYSGCADLDDIFGMIWRWLNGDNGSLFLSETCVHKSAIYKASPYHKLTPDQKAAKIQILSRVKNAVFSNTAAAQLIMVEGEAGTGKTVLTTSTFFDLLEDPSFGNHQISAYMLVNHSEQLALYSTIARNLGFPNDVVSNPTTFINDHPLGSPKIDVVFVDESHLLWSQGKQAYRGNNQLDDIMLRAKVTVIMFDEWQILRKEQYLEQQVLLEKRALAISQGNYIPLNNQLRMACCKATMDWIDDITKNGKVGILNKDPKGYEVKVFDSPNDLHNAIKLKASNSKTELSRLIASYDWPYSDSKLPPMGKYWNVKIGSWSLPWNRELIRHNPPATRRAKLKITRLDWAEQPQTIDEVGSTFTIQGFDLAYAGVIIGPSVRYDTGTDSVYIDANFGPSTPFKRYDEMIGNRTLSNGQTVDVTETLAFNELRILLTRGTNGLYIYAVDDKLRKALKNNVK